MAISGMRVGHATDEKGITGCTVVLCPPGTIGGVDQRGGAPGTRETDLLRPMHLVSQVDAVLLTGGSAFGLDAAGGVVRYLREQGRGFPTTSGVNVPIVPSAVLYDLEIGAADAYPNAQHGYKACLDATDRPFETGNVGAGIGCVIGKFGGIAHATKGGLGTAAINLPGGVVVAALFALNCAGDVLAENGSILGGMRNPDGDGFVGTLNAIQHYPPAKMGSNTVIGVVATNAKLTKEEINKVAQMAQDGLAQAIRPAHTMYDGDTVFSLATQRVDADVSVVGAFAAEVTAAAIRVGVRDAVSLGRIRAFND